MPELPEVQTVLDTLELKIKDASILDIKVLYKPIVSTDIKTFKKKLIGQHFREFKRRGKYLLFEMDDITLVSHLRMEGKYFVQKNDEPLIKHTHVVFCLDNGYELRYNDVRKFGRFELIDKKENYDIFKDLGPEPFSKEFNVKYVKEYFKNCNKPLKEVLLNQSFVAGIGNIYADEICFAVSLKPTYICKNIKEDKIKELIEQTRLILKNAIKAGGTTIRSYTSSLGVSGRFQLKLKIHTLEYCSKCKSKVKKIRVGGRGTYYCERCQKG